MGDKKRVGILIVLIVVSIIGISLVSAGWFSDLFGKGGGEGLEGELAEKKAEAFVNVTAPTTPAEIIFVSPPTPYSVSAGEGYVDLNINATKQFTFTFLANHSSTPILPDSGTHGADEGDLTTTYIIGNFSYPGQTTRWINTYTDSCVYIQDTTYLGSPVKNYSCTVNMSYYDEPFVDWRISVQIMTTAAVWSPVNNTKTFQTTENTEINVYPSSINWSVVIGSLDTLSDNIVVVENLGNVDLVAAPSSGEWHIQMNATQLTGEDTLSYIYAGNFTADEDGGGASTICSQATFLENEWQSLSFVVGHVSTDSDPDDSDLRFCLTEFPPPVTVQEYTSDRMWEMGVEKV